MPALLAANPYVDIILALAFAWLSLKIVRALFGPLYGIPGVGAAIAKLEHVISQSVSHACGSIASGASLAVGGSLHAIARLIERSAAGFKRPALAILQSAALILDTRVAIHALKSLVHRAVGTVGAVVPRVKTLERKWRGIEHRVKHLEREIARGIGHDLRIHIKALEKWEDAAKKQLAADAKAITQTLPGEIDNLYEWAKGKAQLLGVGTFAMAVATALGALGLDWIKCKEGKQIYNQRGCGMWSDIGGLLGVFAAVIAVSDFEELVKEMQRAEQAAVAGIEELLNL